MFHSSRFYNMLSQFIEQGLVKYETRFDTWEEAVRASCQTLIETGRITKDYENAIVDNVKEHGPYIVIVEGIAMPHSTQGGVGVNDTAIAFMKLDEPVYFDPEDETKNAQLFFTLAAVDSEKHLENITNLMSLLMDEEVVEELKHTHSLEELKELAKKHNL